MNRRDTELLAMPTVPAMRGSTSAYLRVETPRTRMSRMRSPSRGSACSRS